MRSVKRMLAVLAALGKYPQGVGVTELAEVVGLPPSSLHRTLQALVKHRLAWQDPVSRNYSLGMGLLDLSLPLLENGLLGELPQRAYSLLAELSDRIQAQTYLSVLAQDDVVGVESVSPTDSRRRNVVSYEARCIPLHCGAAAKAILAFQPSAYAHRMIRQCNFRPYTMYTIVSADEFLRHLESVQETGFALCKEEFELGVTALAVPICDSAGRAFASLGVCAPAHKLEGRSAHKVARALQKSAQHLGGLAAPPPWARRPAPARPN